MSDETYFLIMIIFGVLFILGGIYRLISNRYKPPKKKQKEKIEQFNAPHTEGKAESDLINNPAFSDLEINIFHQNRNGDGD